MIYLPIYLLYDRVLARRVYGCTSYTPYQKNKESVHPIFGVYTLCTPNIYISQKDFLVVSLVILQTMPTL